MSIDRLHALLLSTSLLVVACGEPAPGNPLEGVVDPEVRGKAESLLRRLEYTDCGMVAMGLFHELAELGEPARPVLEHALAEGRGSARYGPLLLDIRAAHDGVPPDHAEEPDDCSACAEMRASNA